MLNIHTYIIDFLTPIIQLMIQGGQLQVFPQKNTSNLKYTMANINHNHAATQIHKIIKEKFRTIILYTTLLSILNITDYCEVDV